VVGGTAHVPPITKESELLARAAALAGRTLGELCIEQSVACPSDLRRAKGLPGQLVERALIGRAPNGVKGPDVAALGVEIKTIPLGHDGRARESTFVCTADLSALCEQSWAQSAVRHKLARVLWVPIESEPAIAIADRRVGRAVLWSPSPDEDAVLAGDWDELASRIAAGEAESITAHVGCWLQLRPKAAHARVLGRGRTGDGALVRVHPRGFYLRSDRTAAIVRSAIVK
jgi:DNA mismatch repair protein MutH